MRKVFLSVLLATAVATPALAAPTDRGDRNTAREERSQARQERREQRSQAREERAQVRGSRPVEVNRNVPAVVEHRDVQVRQPRNVNERGRPALGRVERMEAARQAAHAQSRRQQDSVANWSRQQREDLSRSHVERRVERGTFVQRRRVAPAGARPDRPAPIPQAALHHDRRDSHHRWNTNWRRDHRYDWRNHRRNHRSIFHVGVHFDPFGWGYHRYNVGWRLWPSYYSSNYWLNDPSMYRLPYAQWPYKWVRYYDDAILVDTISGQVVDVIYGFFW